MIERFSRSVSYSISEDICSPIEGSGGVSLDGSPSALVLTVVDDDKIDGTFTIGSTNHDGHEWWYSTDGVNYSLGGTVLGAVNTFQATGLTDGTIYFFEVRAYRGTQYSAFCTAVDACTIPSKFLGATVKFWYDYTDAALKTVDSGRVSQVNDKSANAYHQTQVGIYRPYDLGADGIQGQGSQFISNATALSITGNDTIFMVGRLDTLEAQKAFIQAAIITNVAGDKIRSNGDTPLEVVAPANGIWFLLTSVCNNSGTDILQINNGTAVTATNNKNQVPVNSMLGNTNYAGGIKGSLKMAICLSEVLAAGDITKAQNYLNWKYEVFF